MTKKFSAGIIPVRKVNQHWEFLLLRCFKYWDFPKGEVEVNEDPYTAALRELAEETTITQVKSSPLKFIETEPYSAGKIARYYLGEVLADISIQLLPNPLTGQVEHHQWKWMEAAEADSILVPRIQKVLAWAVGQLKAQA